MRVLNKLIRKNFLAYRFFRKFAPLLCKFLILEDGFEILGNIDKNKISNKVMVDIGANDGTSIAMMRQYYPRIRIYSYEPLLKIPLRLKKLQDNGLLIWNHIALGESNGSIEIFTPVINGKKLDQFSSTSQKSLLANIEKYLDFEKESLQFVSQIVPIKTLDSYNLCPFFIKIDVEGHELSVLKGAKNTIDESQPIILLEINDSEMFDEILSFMASMSYVIHNCQEFEVTKNNYVFMHQDIQMKV
jgi:FkbM family methyltransferase